MPRPLACPVAKSWPPALALWAGSPRAAAWGRRSPAEGMLKSGKPLRPRQGVQRWGAPQTAGTEEAKSAAAPAPGMAAAGESGVGGGRGGARPDTTCALGEEAHSCKSGDWGVP